MLLSDSTSPDRQKPPSVPGWAMSRGPIDSDSEAGFLAGAALNSLDALVRGAPVWAGAWCQRLALTCAASAASLSGRTEDERQIRDAWCLRAVGADPGPAGHFFAAWRHLADRSPHLDAEILAAVTGRLGLRRGDEFLALPDFFDDLVCSGRPAPRLAAAILAEVERLRPDANLLGWWLADCVIAARLRWPFAVPLLITQARGSAFRNADSRGRIRPGEEKFDRAVCVALALAAADACRVAGTLAPRAARLLAIRPKLRAKGAGAVVQLLLSQDAVPGTLQTEKLTRWGARRLFGRLQMFDAVRELSGRPTFRLYGL
ncbi:MAG: DUF1403 family protein [Rhizobiaceae bacterium]|nr:DUF1403 family protein [Rhizobiaceae bacterium]MCO5066924.1 DUF1403 family protein [Rhizobiaceae bacterium]